jgi:hypothetical protein
MLAVLEGFGNFIEHGNSFLFLPTDFQALSFTSPRMDTIHLAAQSLVRLENTKPQMTKCLHQQADTGILSINRTENVATKLLAQAEFFDQGTITVCVFTLQVREQALATVNHHDQAAAGVVILGVGFEMAVEFVDTGGQQCNLYFRRPGIVGTTGIVRNNGGLVDIFY